MTKEEQSITAVWQNVNDQHNKHDRKMERHI
jgi:hypothetical protein